MKRVFLSVFVLLSLSFQLYSQNVTLRGTVLDSKDREPLVGASIYLLDQGKGTITDNKGKYSIEIIDLSASINVSFIGYKTIKTTGAALQADPNVFLTFSTIFENEVIVSASRYNEKTLETPITVQKLSSETLSSSASGDFYESMGNLGQVDVLNNSFNFKVFNTRGFNSSVGYRTVQYIDGVDNISSGINFAPGNFVGVSDIDLDNVEVISGPASALYGPNAIQGVVSMKTKDPFDNPGIALELKGGTRSYVGPQFRYADTFGKKRKLGLKFVVSHNKVNDWIGNDKVVNVYGEGKTDPQDINGILASSDANGSFSESELLLLNELNQFTNQNAEYLPGSVSFSKPGYKEEDLFSGISLNTKVNTAVYYNIKDYLQLKYSFRYANVSGTFQGNNRVYFDNQTYKNHHLELKGKKFFVRTYATLEDLGDSYSFNILGANLYFAGQQNVSNSYLFNYAEFLRNATNDFSSTISSEQLSEITANAQNLAEGEWLEVGSAGFESANEAIISNPEKPQGAKFVNESKIFHIEGQYDFDIKGFMEFNVGGSFRQNVPRTRGTVLADTLQANGEFANISYYETGGYLQGSKSLFNNHLDLKASIRVDKSKNFNTQFSPRGSIVAKAKNQYFRFAVQSAFRNPTQNEQFFRLNVGPVVVLGNVSGYDNMYTLNSVQQFSSTGDANDLESIVIDPVQPEKITSFEFGYKSTLVTNTLFDFSAYYSIYKNFIGRVNTAEPNQGSVVDGSAVSAIQNGDFSAFSIIVNSTSKVRTYGGSLGLTYQPKKNLRFYTNYTFAKLIQEENDGLIPGFNTPQHKVNIGFEVHRLWKGLGVSANWRWSDFYDWQSPFANGRVPAFNTLDAKVFYESDKIHSTFSVGGSNIYNNEHIEAFGGGVIGAFYYAAWKFNFGESLHLHE